MMKGAILLFAAVLVALCVSGCHSQSAESGEGDRRRYRRPGGVFNRPPASMEEEEENEGGAGQGAGNLPGAGGDVVNPLSFTGRELQLYNARLDLVRRELDVLARTISTFLLFNDEQALILAEEMNLSLEIALFPPPPPTTLPPPFGP